MDSLIAIILVNSVVVNQLYLVIKSVKNGMVAKPPPIANKPILKNSIKRVR